MKKELTLAFIFIFTLTGFSHQAQNIEGSWMHTDTHDGKKVNHILLFSGGFFSWTAFYAKDGTFISTRGGSYKMQNNSLVLEYPKSLLGLRIGL